MNRFLRLAFEAAAMAAIGIIGEQVKKHGPQVIEAAVANAPEAAAKIKETVAKIKSKFQPK